MISVKVKKKNKKMIFASKVAFFPPVMYAYCILSQAVVLLVFTV
jgi:hypothetical protein